MKIIFTLFFISVFTSSLAQAACRMVPMEKNVVKYIYNLIKGTPDIYLAKAESYSKDDEAVTFKVIEVIRGTKLESLNINASLITADTKNTNTKNDYSMHRKEIFWKHILEGRTGYGNDCRLNPSFEIGQKYLILYKTPYQAKSFELVNNFGDQWYKHVRDTLYPPKVKKKVQPTQAIEAEVKEAAPPSEPPKAPSN